MLFMQLMPSCGTGAATRTTIIMKYLLVLLYDFLATVKAAPHECVTRTGQT